MSGAIIIQSLFTTVGSVQFAVIAVNQKSSENGKDNLTVLAFELQYTKNVNIYGIGFYCISKSFLWKKTWTI